MAADVYVNEINKKYHECMPSHKLLATIAKGVDKGKRI